MNPTKAANFKKAMIEWIKANFKDVLGDDVYLLDEPNGLDVLQQKIMKRINDLN